MFSTAMPTIRAELGAVRRTRLMARIVADVRRRAAGSIDVAKLRSGTTILAAALGLWVMAPAPARAQSLEWFQRMVTGPAPRIDHAMAYDSARGVTVLFGGLVGSFQSPSFNGETWEWNGIAWTQRVVAGPLPRMGHAMAYDAVRGVTVLFGGNTGSVNGQTWEWNGVAWTQRAVTGPSARYEHAMAYDAARGVTVLFGGATAGDTRNGETWEWNGTAWTQRFVSGPSARYGPAMAYDPVRGVAVLFGGFVGSPGAGDTWEWNGTAWTQRSVTGPSRGDNFAMVYDVARAVTVLFDGSTGFIGETWQWNGSAWSRETIPPPSSSPRGRHAMAYDTRRGMTVLFGGNVSGGGIYFNGETWELGFCSTAVTTQPLDQIGVTGHPVTFGVSASGTSGPLSYRWRKDGGSVLDGGRIAGARTPALTMNYLAASDAGVYDVVISDACGSVTSNGAVLQVDCPAPSVLAHPASQQGLVDQSVVFSAAAVGTGAVSYQWRHNGVALVDGGRFAGVRSAALTINYLTLTDAGSYDVAVTDSCSSATSMSATLAVFCRGDSNRSGSVNSQDFYDFLAAFFGGCP